MNWLKHFGEKKRIRTQEAVDALKQGEFGTISRFVYCSFLRSISLLCDRGDFPAHLAFVPSFDGACAGNYPTYTLTIQCGELNASEYLYDSLKRCLDQDKETASELIQNHFGLSQRETNALFCCGTVYTFDDDAETVEFHSDEVMPYLKASDQVNHFQALGQIIREELPEAYVSAEPGMVFVMFHGK